MAEKIKKELNKISLLVMIFLFVLIAAEGLNLLADRVLAQEVATTSVTVTNSDPTISSLLFHNGVVITLPEWAAGAGTYNASTTFRVTDGNGWLEISTTTIFVYRSGVTLASCDTEAELNINNCYPSTSSADSAWNPRYGDGIRCNRTATGTDWADFWCTTTLYFVAEATDAANSGYDYSGNTWAVYASTSDVNWAQGNSTYSVVEVNTTRALAIGPSTITYASLGAGTNSGTNWITTTASTTGNVVTDVHFDGGAMTKSDDPSIHMAAELQRFTTTSPASYTDSFINKLATTTVTGGKTHDLTMKKPTTTSPTGASADQIFWGIAIPTLQVAGSYSSTTNLTATNTIVVDL